MSLSQVHINVLLLDSCRLTGGMIHYTFVLGHVVSSPVQPYVQNCGLKHHSFIIIDLWTVTIIYYILLYQLSFLYYTVQLSIQQLVVMYALFWCSQSTLVCARNEFFFILFFSHHPSLMLVQLISPLFRKCSFQQILRERIWQIFCGSHYRRTGISAVNRALYCL